MKPVTITEGNTKTVISPDYRDMAEWLLSVPERFSRGDGEVLHCGRNEVRLFDCSGTRLVVKRYKRPNMIQRVAYTFFKKGKAERAFLFAGELRKRGFDTPHEAAYIEIKSGGLLLDSYFISAECTLPAVAPLLDRDEPDSEAASALASLLVRLHEKGVLHGDLNLSNILYSRDGGGHFEFSLIDTNRSKFKQPTKAECLDNLKRLTHNRKLMALMAGLYAGKRGWKAGETVDEVMHELDMFEKKIAKRQNFKRLVKFKKKAR